MLRQRIIEEVGTLGLQSGGCLSVETTRPQIPLNRTANGLRYVRRLSQLIRSDPTRSDRFQAKTNRAGPSALSIPQPRRTLHVSLRLPFLDRVAAVVLTTPLCDGELHLGVVIFQIQAKRDQR